MAPVKINLLLMGKTGQGKSATGNKILKRKVFKTASNTTSQTKDVDFSFVHFGQYDLLVVDGPGLADTDMGNVEDKETAIKHMSKALAVCYGGVDGFLLVTKFGQRITDEDKKAIEALKRIFGDQFMDHVIVVVTCGDNFQAAMEDEERGIDFKQWCLEQKGAFSELYQECNKRVVLFNNMERDESKNEAQIQQIVQIAQGLKRYTSQCFDIAKTQREILILELKAPQLRIEFQEKISLLTAEIDYYCNHRADGDKDRIRARIADLKFEVEIEDKNHGILNDVRRLVKSLEENLHDVVTLLRLKRELEGIRKAKNIWTRLGAAVAGTGGAMALVVPPVGLAVAAGGVVIGAGGRAIAGKDESAIEMLCNDLQRKRQL